jgi:hypothetical protein
MNVFHKGLIAMAVSASVGATGASAQSAKDIVGPSPLVAIENEQAPKPKSTSRGG